MPTTDWETGRESGGVVSFALDINSVCLSYAFHANRSSRRVSFLNASTISFREAFLEEKRNQESKGLYCTSIIGGYQDFIFCDRFGEVLNLGVIKKALRRIIRDCNDQVLDNHEGDDMPVLLPRFSCRFKFGQEHHIHLTLRLKKYIDAVLIKVQVRI